MGITENGLYDYLAHKNMARLRESVFEKEFKKGEEVYGPSRHYTHIYELVEGAIKLGSISRRGVGIMHEILVREEFFGNLRLLDNNAGLFGKLKGLHKPFSEFSKALVPTVVRCYEYDFFRHLMINDPNVAEWFYSKIVSRWCKTESLFICILSLPPRERIKHVYDLYDTKIRTGEHREVYLNKSLSFQEIADLTGTTRQLVAATLRLNWNFPHQSNRSIKTRSLQ